MKYILTIAIVLLLSNCKKDKDEEEEDNTIHTLGEVYKGGIVAYILQAQDPGFDPDKQHGLIVADKNQSMGISWGLAGVGVPGTSAAVGKGKANTEAIVKKYPKGNYAANICDTLNLNGYSDWYLPSKDELDKIFFTKSGIPALSGMTLKYWTSTAGTVDGRAYSMKFDTGERIDQSADNPTIWVRAIRSF